MFRYRFIYAITLISAVVFYAMYNPWFSWYLLLIVILLIPLDLLISLPGILSRKIKLSAPVVLESDAYGAVRITAVCKNKFPVRCIYVKLRITGDDFTAQCKVFNNGDAGAKSDIIIDSKHTGLTVFEVKRISVVSLFGLFSHRVKNVSRAAVLVLPSPQRPLSTINLPRGLILRPKPGGGFSEEHDMREYRAGDPIRSIHWKLSAKFDSFIIREPLIPPEQSRLIHLMPWKNEAQRDAMLSHLRWVCQYLIEKGFTFHIKYSNLPLIEEISSESDMVQFLHKALDRNSAAKAMYGPVFTRFMWVYKIEAKV